MKKLFLLKLFLLIYTRVLFLLTCQHYFLSAVVFIFCVAEYTLKIINLVTRVLVNCENFCFINGYINY